MTSLRDLVVAQYDLQKDSFGLDPLKLEGEDRLEYLRWNALALENELHELLQETGWKPWSTSWHVNEEEALQEFADLVHFALNVALVIAPRGWSPDDVAATIVDRYFKKREVNAERQENGYDGIAGKCPGCHRDLAEIGTIGVLLEDDELTAARACNGCGKVLS